MQIKLFWKTIAIGYLLIALLIGSIAYTSFYEWQRLEFLEEENKLINSFRKQLHDSYMRMIEFSLFGETILEWESEDLEHYHSCRMEMDSMLCRFKTVYPAERIDSIRHLLEDKEVQMRHIVKVLDEQNTMNEKIARQVPVIALNSAREESKKLKRKGFLGIFGKKENPKPTTTTVMLYTLSHDVIAQQKMQSRQLQLYADSLAARNEDLNIQLQELIVRMDDKVQHDLQKREFEITAMREDSFILVGGMTTFVLALLLISYIIIHSNNRRIKRYKRETANLIDKLEQAVQRNESLMDARQKTMQTITHELRTPLTAIYGYAELIPEENDAEKITRYTDSIRQASKRMITMLNSMLEFFRLDSGKEHINVCPFRLSAVVDNLLAEFTPQADAKDLRLTVENCTDIILMGDRDRIIQICDNLLNNALKFTAMGGIILRTDYADGMLTLIVEDSGSGMSKDEQQRVFDAFERLSNAATQDGFGLGLSIVKHIVDMLRGTIRLDSEKGRGSRFTVTIPMQTTDAIAEKDKEQTPNMGKLYSVLVLDDNEVVLNMIKDMYASAGVHCDTSRNVGDMMEAMRTRSYDFMITDLKMPEMNGYEVLELMRSSSIGNSKEIPIIVATASGSCDEEDLLAHGFTACLFKPFSRNELLAVSEKCVSSGPRKENVPDFSSLLAYGGGCRLLDSLISETESDLKKLAQAEATDNREAIAAIAHHLRSSWGVIRADGPLWILQTLLNDPDSCRVEELDTAVRKVLEQGRAIIVAAKGERGKYGKNHRD